MLAFTVPMARSRVHGSARETILVLTNLRKRWRAAAVSVFPALFLAACSGGGGGGTNSAPVSTPPPPTTTSPVWTAGVFEPASRFKDQCAAPRSGVDIEGNTFPDRPGTLLEEKFWLRSWTEETYLWNDEVADRNPSDFTDRLSYFDVLRTTEVTPSGEDKDDFHFSQPTEEFLEQRNSAPSASYGVQYAAFSTSPPRDFQIQYTDPDTPASASVGGQVNFVRGARILEVDGVDLINATSQADIDTLNAGLFPETAGET
ncbi:MAG: peptidase, partial [Pseudomonadota bacterium]